jgi:hypothetical protein
MTQSEVLTKIWRDMRALRAQKASGLAVFDLDSTLFDVSPRIRQILWDFAHHPEYSRRFPDAMEIVKNLKTERSDWGIKDALLRGGMDTHPEEFHDCIRTFWKENFFSNPYLHYDVPYDGAVQFVDQLWQEGIEIAYLTGRDVIRMGTGSRDVLLKWNFPLDDRRANLVLKPKAGEDDAEFKRRYFDRIDQSKYGKIWLFENEPLNILEVQKHHPKVEMIFIDSTHSRRANVPPDLPTILHFLFNE